MDHILNKGKTIKWTEFENVSTLHINGQTIRLQKCTEIAPSSAQKQFEVLNSQSIAEREREFIR